ncbi:helix-turn-helix domain-containing protein [Kibdelosporangium philippinense]|uniref:Helix-turn-helix domain-containing protein n=1 Tax=Kibdelosporangium philippinense TaxID=211113 RepID=A0ABS8ZNT0_9PSEU|nr:helix-turn-helix domain-containing protein [Kibdelosporangium philippinense]MCE7009420.1 helix-turn-helix domain-containing protein [Kibdelosporangium philippinense]
MLDEAVFSSADLPAAERFPAWRDVMASLHAPMDLTSDYAADFDARMRVIDLGGMVVWPATFDPLTFRRSRKLIRQSDPETVHLSLLLQGSAGMRLDRHEKTCDVLDIHTNDSSRPYEITTGDARIKSIGVEIPKALLPLPRHQAEKAVGLPMSGKDGIGSLLTHFLTQLTSDTAAYQPSDAPRLGTVLTDLVAAVFGHALDRPVVLESHKRTLVLRIKDFIRRNLHDPALNPGMIAAAHHISLSYLHRLFREEAETVAAWIRVQRLESARRDLATGTAPIHAVAARWGFVRAADFTRAFRAAYGVAPKEYRASAS